MTMFKRRYRIVTDNYSGFEVQFKNWFWPFWMQCQFTNTHRTLEEAMDFMTEDKAGHHRPKTVWRDDDEQAD